MIPILYEKDETAFVSNGLCRLRDCIECLVVEERNSVYECNFSYPVDGANFDMIQIGRIIGVTHDESDDVQPFDIVSFEKPIDGVVEFHAVHISYRQSYLTVKGKNINSLSAAFTLFENATPKNPFTYLTDKTSTGYLSSADGIPKTVRSMLGGVEGSVLDVYGGEYEWDKFVVKLWASRGQQRDFQIRYGVNMVDYNEEVDIQGSYTSCIPYWTDGSDSVVGSKQDSGIPTVTNRGECVPLDVSNKFKNKPTKAQVEAMGRAQMNRKKPYLPVQTIHVEFIRLQDMPEYEGFANLLQCGLCDTIQVIFPDYNSSGWFKIVKTEWNVLRDRYDSMELGDLSMSLSEALGVDNLGDNRYVAPEDYVTEQGTDGSWAYRKWNSGKVEAWFKGNVTVSATTATGNVHRGTFSLAIPSGIFSATPSRVLMTVADNTNTVISVQGDASSETNINGRAFKSTSSTSTSTAGIAVYASRG